MTSKPHFVTMFCDASYCHKTHATGWAVWIKHGAPPQTLRLSGSARDVRGSDRAERLALEKGIEHLCREVDLRNTILIIESDCQGALAQVDTDPLLALGANLVKLKWVKGHQGVRNPRSAVNTWCDKEAKAQMRPLRDQIYRERAISSPTPEPSP